jgi:hypothetical protein
VRGRGTVELRSVGTPRRRRARRATKPANRDIEGEIQARRKALADLMHSKVLGQGDLLRAFKLITEYPAHRAIA